MNFFHGEHGDPTRRTQSQSLPSCRSLPDLCVRAPARLRVQIIQRHPRPSVQSAVKKSVLRLLPFALLLAASACRREERKENPVTPPPTSASTADPAEVFRRAFWRHPAADDRILQAERRVSPADESWQWFIQLHPGPELLAALRNPETFGLAPARDRNAPQTVVADLPPPPAWFVAAGSADFEVLHASAGGLTVFYRAGDNLLYATDHGRGFAAPARPL